MLVLSRHVDEEIVIQTPDGSIISIMPVEIRGDKVRLGLTAPRDVQIYRREIWDTLQEEASDALPAVAQPAA